MSDRFSSSSGISRNAVIAGSVILFHAAALWALQTGLLRRAAEVVVPVVILSQFVDPPTPIEPPPPPPAPPPPPEPPKEVVKPPPPKPRPLPVHRPAPKPSPLAPVAAPEPPPAPPAPPAPPPPAPPAPPAVQLPTTNADYARSCNPTYPSISKRLGEEGLVMLNVLVSADGQPQKIIVKKSSGFERLDEAAREAMQRCRFVPGKVNGVAQSMAYDAPINFVLK